MKSFHDLQQLERRLSEIENSFHQSSNLPPSLDNQTADVSNDDNARYDRDERESTISDLSSLNYNEDRECSDSKDEDDGINDMNSSTIKWVMAFDRERGDYYWLNNLIFDL